MGVSLHLTPLNFWSRIAGSYIRHRTVPLRWVCLVEHCRRAGDGDRGDLLAENAKENKGIVEKRMSREQIAKAQELSSKLWEKYVVPFQKD